MKISGLLEVGKKRVGWMPNPYFTVRNTAAYTVTVTFQWLYLWASIVWFGDAHDAH